MPKLPDKAKILKIILIFTSEIINPCAKKQNEVQEISILRTWLEIKLCLSFLISVSKLISLSGSDEHLERKILDPERLSRVESIFGNLSETIKIYGPWSSAWVGEAGGAYNSGGNHVSNRFLNSFWWVKLVVHSFHQFLFFFNF